MNKVLVVGPGIETRGGITSVIKAHSETETWEKWNCKWISSYVDRSPSHKILYFLKGYLSFLVHLPGSSIVHIHFSEPMSAIRKMFFFKTAQLFRKKIILHFHSFSPDTTIFGSYANLYKKMFDKSDSIIALSGFWKNELSKIVDDRSKISVLYNPCPNISKSISNSKSKEILFAGTLNERKGYKDLIEAFGKVVAGFPDWKLVFAGNGEIKNGRLLSRELQIEEKIEFMGWVSGKEKDYLFRSASIFCLPSYAEGFPMAVLDAWAYALPVITTPVGGLPDILEHEKNALVFEAGDIDSLAKNLVSLMSSVEQQKLLSEKSLELSQTTFNLNNIHFKLDKLYQTI